MTWSVVWYTTDTCITILSMKHQFKMESFNKSSFRSPLYGNGLTPFRYFLVLPYKPFLQKVLPYTPFLQFRIYKLMSTDFKVKKEYGRSKNEVLCFTRACKQLVRNGLQQTWIDEKFIGRTRPISRFRKKYLISPGIIFWSQRGF